LSLLYEIQESVVKEGSNLGSVLLKLRLLASRLGSDLLEEWVKHESEGYPNVIDVPAYRIVGASYRGTFWGPGGSGVQNAQIPQHLIEKYAGSRWVNIEIRESIAVVDDLVKSSSDGDRALGIDASDLILLLQDKIYKGYACNDILASISRTGLADIQQSVRSRILELTLELEKNIPVASQVTFGAPDKKRADVDQVQNITQQIIYGNVTTAVSGGSGSNIDVTIGAKDTESLKKHLVQSGISEDDVNELSTIMESEEPESIEEPFGDSAKNWIAANIGKAANGSWKIGINLATKVLSEAALKYYDLK
jgi:hypothetical protein